MSQLLESSYQDGSILQLLQLSFQDADQGTFCGLVLARLDFVQSGQVLSQPALTLVGCSLQKVSMLNQICAAEICDSSSLMVATSGHLNQ